MLSFYWKMSAEFKENSNVYLLKKKLIFEIEEYKTFFYDSRTLIVLWNYKFLIMT